MNAATLKEYCLSKKSAVEDFPFGPDPLVIKVQSKMFALINSRSVSLKCDPVLAEDFRQRYSSVTAGYHLSKKHWNTITLDGDVPESELYWMLDHSYELVVKSLTKAQREALKCGD